MSNPKEKGESTSPETTGMGNRVLLMKILISFFERFSRHPTLRDFFLLVSFFVFSTTFSQVQQFKSSRIKINNYGTREQTTTILPNIITLDLHDSLITIQPEHIAVSEFLGFQNQFEITGSFGTGITTHVFFTSSEYVFTFDKKMRVVVISKKEISPHVHSVWLEEITN